MKRILPVAILSTILFACLTEDGAERGKGSTFLRYYNGGFDDQAEAFEETPDNGFIILASTQITNSNVEVQRSKIKLIKVDQYGNTEWQTLYPAFTDVANTTYYKAKGILLEKDGAGAVIGYTIVGESIVRNTDGTSAVSYLYIMQTDANGNFTRGNSLPLQNVQGQSIVKDNGGYLVLGARSNSTEDMVVARFNESDLSVDWFREYGEGGSENITGLIKDADDNIFWGGTVRINNQTDMRLVKTKPMELGTEFGREYGQPESNEETAGICYSGFGPYFAFVGTTDELDSKDILYKKISITGNTQFSKVIGSADIPEEGNAICTTSDGGLLIIGTSGLDEARDYYLIKLDHLGEIVWSRIFGSKNADKGVSVKQVSDGSYIILGSTTLGGLNTIMLLRADPQGKIR
jgi:hypothetical protein